MSVLLLILGAIAGLGGLVCTIIILIAAFQDAVWKGLVFLLCGFYALYYMFFEFDHENKWGIVAGALLGGIVCAALQFAAGGMAVPR